MGTTRLADSLTDDGGLPSRVVPRGVRLVHLEARVRIPACKHEGDTEGTQAAVLSVRLLVVAHGLDQIRDRHRLLVVVQVPEEDVVEVVLWTCMKSCTRHKPVNKSPLCGYARLVDKNIRVGSESCHEARGVCIEHVCLLASLGGCEELGDHAPLRGKDNAIGALQAHAGACVVDGLDGVLHLVEAA